MSKPLKKKEFLDVKKIGEISEREPGQIVRVNGITGEKVPAEKRAMIIDMLNRGLPIVEIEDALNTDCRTIAAVAANFAPELAQAKLNLQRKAYLMTVASMESAFQRAREGKGTALDAKLAGELWLTLQGEATNVQEFRITLPALMEVKDRLAKSDVTVIDAECVPSSQENERQGIAPSVPSSPPALDLDALGDGEE